jgi:hypothetical protein
MGQDFFVYQKGIDIIKSSGIEQRVKVFRENNDLSGGSNSFTLERWSCDIVPIVNELKKSGFYAKIPEDFKEKYFTIMNDMLKAPEHHFWKLQTSTGEILQPMRREDVDLFSGSIASLILNSDEIWKYPEFGFDSPTDLIGTIGAYMINEGQKSSHHGYVWTGEQKNGILVKNEITGDSSADMRVFQEDVSEYPIRDCFDNKVNFKRITRYGALFGAHSVEPSLMSIALKYIDQLNIEVSFKKDKAHSLLEWAGNLYQENLNAIENGDYRMPVSLFFTEYSQNIPVLDNNSSTQSHSIFHIGRNSDNFYTAYISSDGDLVFASEDNKTYAKPLKDIHAIFTPSDAEHIVKGLLFASVKHLGRTSVHELADMLKYRYSDDFESDQLEFSRY